MLRLIQRASRKVGLPPGSLVHVGEEKTEKTTITVIDYDEEHVEEVQARTVAECLPFAERPTVTWINVTGVHEGHVIEEIGKHFHLHPLLLEDVMNTVQRPKIEDFDDALFIVLKMLRYDDEKHEVQSEQLSFVLGPSFVISFQETEGDVFDALRHRIRVETSRMRQGKTDYLMYRLLDAVVDSYFTILEQLGEKTETVERELMEDPTRETLRAIHHLKREVTLLRRAVWPVREVVNSLTRGDTALIEETTVLYLRDVYDHTVQVIETAEALRDLVAGMLETYLSSLSNRMNEVMKVLTIIATLFIPLTFIAGVYGMNFKYMPELEWHWAYPAAISAMAVVAGVMLIYFRRKDWL